MNEFGFSPDQPEEIEPQGEASPTDAELLDEALSGESIGEGTEVIGVGPVREAMPGVRLDPTETDSAALTTALGVERAKMVAIERFVQDQCVRIEDYRLGGFALAVGVVCTDIDRKVGVITSARLEPDPAAEAELKTLPVLTLRYADGSTREVKSAKPVYDQMKKVQIPPELGVATHASVGDKEFRLGQYVDIDQIESFVGQVAVLLDQDQFPEMVGVMMIGTVSSDRAPRLYAVPASLLNPR